MFAFTIILMLALGAVLYLMVRALPRIVEEPRTEESFLDRWEKSRIPEKIDAALNGFLVKFLRRLKVFALKFDNAVSVGLRKVSKEEQSKKPDFAAREAAGEANGEEKKDAGMSGE